MFLLRNGRYTKIQNYNKIRAKIAFKDLRYDRLLLFVIIIKLNIYFQTLVFQMTFFQIRSTIKQTEPSNNINMPMRKNNY